jgi:hypothetical protein
MPLTAIPHMAAFLQPQSVNPGSFQISLHTNSLARGEVK